MFLLAASVLGAALFLLLVLFPDVRWVLFSALAG